VLGAHTRPPLPMQPGAGGDRPPLMPVQGPPAHLLAAHPRTDAALGVVRPSILPSQPELAAEQTSQVNWKQEPHVVQGVCAAAKTDPAATVRASCVRALGKMKATTPAVMQTFQDVKKDKDEDVRAEVEALGKEK